MIRVFFQGGLGNQMFQYAAARCLSEQYGVELCFDLSWYCNPWNRQFLLAEFGIKAQRKKSFLSGLSNRFIEKPLFELLGTTPVYREPSRVFDPEFFNVPSDCSLIGFFQSEKYFNSIEPIVRECFSFSHIQTSNDISSWQRRIEGSNAVAVHVRRGDFLKLDGFCVCNEQYYYRAIKYMRSRVDTPSFYFFSDDLEWCRQMFCGDDYVFCDVTHANGSPLDDLRLIAQCKHHILTNSSFSWWGAWLGSSGSQEVVVPEKWRATGEDVSDVFCKEWVRLAVPA